MGFGVYWHLAWGPVFQLSDILTTIYSLSNGNLVEIPTRPLFPRTHTYHFILTTDLFVLHKVGIGLRWWPWALFPGPLAKDMMIETGGSGRRILSRTLADLCNGVVRHFTTFFLCRLFFLTVNIVDVF